MSYSCPCSCSSSCATDLRIRTPKTNTTGGLFVPQRVDRVQRGRFPCWIEPEGCGDRARRDRRRPVHERRQTSRNPEAEPHTNEPSDKAQDNGLDEELDEHVASTRAQRKAPADFARPF